MPKIKHCVVVNDNLTAEYNLGIYRKSLSKEIKVNCAEIMLNKIIISY